MDSIVEALGNEYELDTGFIGRLRAERVFDQAKAERYLSTLAALEVTDGSISLDLVKLLWNLPMMLQWQWERAESSEMQDKIAHVLNETINILWDKVGAP
jgi:hypothetical protein